MANVNLGGNLYFGVPFPLVLADRFFNIYEDHGRMQVDVFRWDEGKREAIYEVRGGQPLQENIDRNPTGIVTFGDEEGGFLFKFRPKPGVSQIFGKVPSDGEVTVHISDKQLAVERGDQTIVTVERSQFSGFPIGVEVGADGSVGMGVNRLPAGMNLTTADQS